MAGRLQGIQNNQSAINYVNKKGINELFEAIMTGLMVNKPDDHIAFIRECLDKVPANSPRIRWDLFLANTSMRKSTSPSRPTMAKIRQRPLPPVRNSNSMPRTNQTLLRRTATKPIALPPIENSKKSEQNRPIVFILSSSSSTTLCSRLMERYNQVTYLYINDVANIDDDIDLKRQEHRYDSVQRYIEQYRSNTQAFLIAGQLNEKNFCKQWQEKLGRIDLIILLSSDQQSVLNLNLQFLQINSNDDFDTILTNAIRAIDEIFSPNTSMNESFQSKLNLPIIFCIDNHRLVGKENQKKLMEHSSIDEEFDMASNEQEEQINNSFIYTLSERIAEQFSFKHIHYEDSKKTFIDFHQMKTFIIESMSSSVGFIIDEFPTSFDDLRKFETEIGPCTVLIYIGEHQIDAKDDELNGIVEKFKELNKAIFIDCRMEVDEVYEDLKTEILKYI